MKIHTTKAEKYTELKIEGSLSNENLHELETYFTRLHNSRSNIILDLTDVTFICSSALSLLLSTGKNASKNGISFLVFGLTADMEKLFSVTELNRHLHIFAARDQALAHFDKKHG